MENTELDVVDYLVGLTFGLEFLVKLDTDCTNFFSRKTRKARNLCCCVDAANPLVD